MSQYLGRRSLISILGGRVRKRRGIVIVRVAEMILRRLRRRMATSSCKS